MRTLGVELALRLAAHGVRDVFGIPGVHNVELYRGLHTAGLRHVLARHEQGVGFMADGYARATNKPGVGLVISGPGVTNIMTPMGQAYSDHVPMLILSSCLSDCEGKQGQLHQMLDQRGAADAVCAWSVEARSAASALALVDQAFAEFAAGGSRPIHIQVPVDLLAGPCASLPVSRPDPSTPYERAPEDGVLQTIMGASKPLFIFGGGARHAFAAARQVIEQSGAACFTTYTGRGIIADGHPKLFGATLARPSSADVMAQADVVIAVGTELAEVDLWREQLGHKGTLIRVDISTQSLADGQVNQHQVQCDAARFLDDLSQAYRQSGHQPSVGWQASDVAARRLAWRAEIDADLPGLVPVIDALKAAIPANAMIYSDMTQLAYSGKELWDMAEPGLWHHPCGFGTLGYALPAALGGLTAQASAPTGRPVIAIAGDYGFQYTLQELGTAQELGGPMAILLWDNGKLKEIEDCMIKSQITPTAIQAFNPDFALLTKAYGLNYDAPSTLGQIAGAVAKALAATSPTIIHLTPDLTQ